MSRVDKAREFRAVGCMAAQGASDEQALSMPSLYPYWAVGVAYGGEGEPSIVRQPGGKLYRLNEGKAHTSQEGWEPEVNSTGLWVCINDSNAGTEADPIPAARGMEYEYGLYYLDEEDGNTYLCERTGEAAGGKIVLQYLPHELVGQYFTEVNS